MSGEIERRGEHDVWGADYGYTREQWQQQRGHSTARKAGELDPEWVMVGVDVPAGKRLYASKDLRGSAFGVAMDAYGNGDGWHMLVITKPTYGECLAELQRIWQNWASEGRELPAGRVERRAI